jgi:hypothetical protein
MTGWQPLSTRNVKRSPVADALHDGVPAHLAQPMLHWLNSIFDDDYGHRSYRDVSDMERWAHRIAARVRLDIQRFRLNEHGNISGPVENPYRGNNPASQTILAVAKRDVRRSRFSSLFGRRSSRNATRFLDIIDAALADGVKMEKAIELERLLADGGSAWRVADDNKGLQKRVDPTALEALQAISDTTAGIHLSAAWTAAYGRHPIPSRAYSEAIKAVEAACIPVVLPGAQGAKATLGKVIIALNNHQQDWQLAILSSGAPADISPLLAMLRLLWQGQTDRHGGSTPTIPVTAQAAEAVVHLAVTLVQWFQSGAIQRVGAP